MSMQIDGRAAQAAPRPGDDPADSGWGTLMDELAYGILVTSLDRRLQQANQAARHELARARTLGARGGELLTHNAEDARALQDALDKAAQGKRSLITLVGSGGPPLTLAVLPMRADGRGGPVRAALMFSRASVCESLMLCFFARSHGLTSAEENVLGILCQGYSAPEIASQLNVAVSTVRSHVRSLCAKTRSSGVRELVSRVAVLPPVVPSLPAEHIH